MAEDTDFQNEAPAQDPAALTEAEAEVLELLKTELPKQARETAKQRRARRMAESQEEIKDAIKLMHERNDKVPNGPAHRAASIASRLPGLNKEKPPVIEGVVSVDQVRGAHIAAKFLRAAQQRRGGL